MKPFAPEDLYHHRTLRSLAGSPAHTHFAYVVSRARRGRDGYDSVASRLALEEPQRRAPCAITSRVHSASSLQFSPDGGTLAFLSRRNSHGLQVYLLPWDVGEARRLTRLDCTPSRIEGFSPAGDALLLLASERIADADGPCVADFLPYKLDGSGFVARERTRLLRVELASGRTSRLVDGDFDVSGAQWSPDGQRLAYVRTAGGRERHRRELWIARADGSRGRRVCESLTDAYGVRWSPDGRALAFGGSDCEGDSRTTLWHYDVEADRLRRLAGEDVELAVSSSVLWHPDGERVAAICARRGLQSIAVVPIGGGDPRLLDTRLRHVLELCASGERLAFTVASMRWPVELHSVRWDGSDERRHTAHNRGWAARRIRPRVSKRAFDVPDGNGGTEAVEAWVLTPPEPAQRPFPLLVDMHGGPQSHALIDHASHWYWSVLLSRGWTVVAPNAVGSGSYGKAFSQRLRGRWGELDLPQYLAIVEALQKEGLADARLACAGKSYGGYLSAWAIGQTDRFKAAVVSAPVTNVMSHAGTSDTGYYVSLYAMDARFQDLPAASARLSPAIHAPDAHTATLILQGADDQRCPVGQAEELFATLVRCTQDPVRLVVYPGGSHQLAGSGKPSLRVDYHRRIVEWLERYVA